eukprot:SAG31_NODE_954_length_10804_cov_3.240355_11_plen_80_part_00
MKTKRTKNAGTTFSTSVPDLVTQVQITRCSTISKSVPNSEIIPHKTASALNLHGSKHQPSPGTQIAAPTIDSKGLRTQL